MTAYCHVCLEPTSLHTYSNLRKKYNDVVGVKLKQSKKLCYICSSLVFKWWGFRARCRQAQHSLGEEGKHGKTSLTPTLNVKQYKTSDINHTIICTDPYCYSLDDKTYTDNLDEDVDDSGDVKVERIDVDDVIKSEENVNDSVDRLYSGNIDEALETHVGSDTFNDAIEEKIDEVSSVDCNDGNLDDSKSSFNEAEVTIHKNETKDSKKTKKKKTDGVTDTDEDRKGASFKKIVLSLEQQMGELEARRKEVKYVQSEFKCYKCGVAFLVKLSYQSHMVRHEESNGQFSCAICSLRFPSRVVLRLHSALHAERHCCSQCGRLVKKTQRRSHADVCWGAVRVTCDQCGKCYKDQGLLRQHVKRMHTVRNKVHACTICNREYREPASLRMHMIKHSNLRYNCDECKSSFNNPYALNHHKKEHNLSLDSGETFYCAPCNTWYKSAKILGMHLRNSMKHKTIRYECSICGRACATKVTLQSHIEAMHSEEKSYACNLCPRRYTSQKSYAKHLKSHSCSTELPTIICHQCGRDFKGQGRLNRHLKLQCRQREKSIYHLDNT